MSAGSLKTGRPSAYPPPDQVLSAMGIEVSWPDPETLLARALVEPALLGRDGRPSGVGALVPIVDMVAGIRATALSAGDWLATSDVWLHQRGPVERGPLELSTRLLRAGKRTVVSAIEVSADGGPVVSATVEFTRIRREASTHTTANAPGPPGWTRVGTGPLLDRSLEATCGFRIVDPSIGHVELEQSPFVANSTGTLQGGVVALLADVAAAAMVGPGSRTVDLEYRFLAPTGAGPARTSAEVLRVDGAHHVVRVEVVDAANGELVGWAVCGVLRA